MQEQTSHTPGPHTLSRFDGDLGRFRTLVLKLGSEVVEQTRLASASLAQCDIAKARKVIDRRRRIRDLDMEALETNSRLFAVHQPVARDLRLLLALSRGVYDLECISSEAVRLAGVAEQIYEHRPTPRDCVIFQDVQRMADPAIGLLGQSLTALAGEDMALAVRVARDGAQLEDLFRRSLRRLATYLMEDPRNIRWVMDCTLGVKAMERVGDHACSIARSIVYSVTGRDVRHSSLDALGGG